MILRFFFVFIFFSGFLVFFFLCLRVVSSSLGLVLIIGLVYYGGRDLRISTDLS
jgi:hypothetical protein